MWFHSPPFLLRMEAWNQETKDNMNGMHSSCFHSQLQPHCLPAVPLPRTHSCLPACWQDQALTVERMPASLGALRRKAQAGQGVQHLVHPPQRCFSSVGRPVPVPAPRAGRDRHRLGSPPAPPLGPALC